MSGVISLIGPEVLESTGNRTGTPDTAATKKRSSSDKLLQEEEDGPEGDHQQPSKQRKRLPAGAGASSSSSTGGPLGASEPIASNSSATAIEDPIKPTPIPKMLPPSKQKRAIASVQQTTALAAKYLLDCEKMSTCKNLKPSAVEGWIGKLAKASKVEQTVQVCTQPVAKISGLLKKFRSSKNFFFTVSKAGGCIPKSEFGFPWSLVVASRCGLPLWFPAVVSSCGLQLWSPAVVSSCGLPLWSPAVVSSGLPPFRRFQGRWVRSRIRNRLSVVFGRVLPLRSPAEFSCGLPLGSRCGFLQCFSRCGLPSYSPAVVSCRGLVLWSPAMVPRLGLPLRSLPLRSLAVVSRCGRLRWSSAVVSRSGLPLWSRGRGLYGLV